MVINLLTLGCLIFVSYLFSESRLWIYTLFANGFIFASSQSYIPHVYNIKTLPIGIYLPISGISKIKTRVNIFLLTAW